VDLIAVGDLVWYESITYDVSQGHVSGDGVFGAAYALPGKPLTTFLAYFNEAASWTGGSGAGASVSVNGAGSFIGTAYRGLVEVDGNGNALSGDRFATLTFTGPLSGVTTAGPVKYDSFTSQPTLQNPNFEISFTFASSDTPVYLTNGALLTPKSIQTTINILNYPFVSNTSSLILVVLLATASGSVSGSVQTNGNFHSLGAGSGNSAVYFNGAIQAYVDANGNTKSVNFVTAGAGEIDFDGADFLTQFDALKGSVKNLQYDLKGVNITLPNSANITYDPTTAASDNPNAGQSGASSLKAQLPLVVLFAIISMLFC